MSHILHGVSGAAYRLEQLVSGIGGQAVVYRATALDDARTVAVKLAQEPGADGRWLLQQAEHLGRLAEHPIAGPCFVPLWDHGIWQERPFLVLDWVEMTLASWAPGQPLERRCQAALALLQIVATLHRASPPVIHGDLKPANILIRDEGKALVILLTDPADLASGMLTPGYAPPEQILGLPPEPGWDRFALAATLWGCLCGQPPIGPRQILPFLDRASWPQALPTRRGAGLDPSDRVAFDQGAPGRAAVRAALTGLLHPHPRRRVADLTALERALRGAPEPRVHRWRVPVLALSAGLLGLGLLRLGLRGGAEAPPCPEGWQLQEGACEAADGRRMVHIPAGTFQMGQSGPDDAAWTRDALPHPATIHRAFWLGDGEVTQALWQQVTGESPVATRSWLLPDLQPTPCAVWLEQSLVAPDLPVVCISWLDAIEFLNALSRQDGLQPAYHRHHEEIRWDPEADGWRLPTEAEWEYAARAGTTDAWVGLSARDEICAIDNTRDRDALEVWSGEVRCGDGAPLLAPGHRYLPNAWGLYDMLGNVQEWVWDAYLPYDAGVREPLRADLALPRVLRGASWNHVAKGPAARYAAMASEYTSTVGLRLARSVSR